MHLKKKDSNEAFLAVGDTSGHVHLFHFLNPNRSLYNEALKPVKHALELHLSSLAAHADFIRYTPLGDLHRDSVRSVQFVHASKTVVSCSSEAHRSVVISDPEFVKKAYVFGLLKGCSCFDFNLELHLLVTASYNACIFLWNYYSPSKPVSVLRGHAATVIGLKIQPGINYLYSLSSDSVLKAWGK